MRRATYTRVEDDVGKYLRATATYKDPESTVYHMSSQVTAQRATDRKDCTGSGLAPVFQDADGEGVDGHN